ncbi:MAG: ferritin-like domain-containing protein [Verrucomicrobia bacterium]|nr:ferritin-like domain-containing protein [Verrucomicrobiota bacterium]
MNDNPVISKSGPIHERIIELLNDDLASEFQALIAFIVYSQVLEEFGYAEIATELERHAAGDFQHVKQLAKQIESLGGIPRVTWMADQATGEAAATRNVAPDREPAAMGRYSYLRRGAAQIGEILSSTSLRDLIVGIRAPPIDLAAALGIVSTPATRVRGRANALNGSSRQAGPTPHRVVGKAAAI